MHPLIPDIVVRCHLAGLPDGMAIDVEGKLWVVVGETGSVRQYDPETGKEVARVQLPVVRVTSCAFGGTGQALGGAGGGWGLERLENVAC